MIGVPSLSVHNTFLCCSLYLRTQNIFPILSKYIFELRSVIKQFLISVQVTFHFNLWYCFLRISPEIIMFHLFLESH